MTPPAVQKAIGWLTLHWLPGFRNRLLKSWTQGGTNLEGTARWWFDAVSDAVDLEYFSDSTTTERREALKAICMGTDSGVEWAHAYLKRGFPDAMSEKLSMFGYLEEILGAGTVRSVHQVACCSGREIGYYARRHPEIEFCGSDVDSEIVEFLRRHWSEVPNLRFEVVPLESTASGHRRQLCADLIFASGGLHYLDEHSLKRFFSDCRDVCETLLISQPLDTDFDPTQASKSSARRQLSWSHPYVRYLKESGWSQLRWGEMRPVEDPRFKNLAVEAHVGESN
ncbi:class I SAM-dependent methyltransferase [Myxococcota bacterium]|nr:class I SAM-dependent methyltransferase [Myxococcota bacterium]